MKIGDKVHLPSGIDATVCSFTIVDTNGPLSALCRTDSGHEESVSVDHLVTATSDNFPAVARMIDNSPGADHAE